MRHGASSRRSRNRGNTGGRRNNQNRMQVYDSNGPDVRIRGTAHQVHEKYAALAKDAAGAGDHILAESYLQHAEHYQRLINSWEDHVETDGSRLDAEIQEEKMRREQAAKRRMEAEEADGNTDDDQDDLGLPESITGEDAPKKRTRKVTKQEIMEDA